MLSIAGAKWALFAMPDGGAWSKGNIALLGDASHAMLPFVAQGAGMAIEDAMVIAKCPADAQGTVGSAFAQYAKLRAPRVTRAQRYRAPDRRDLSSEAARWDSPVIRSSKHWADRACSLGRTGSTIGGCRDRQSVLTLGRGRFSRRCGRRRRWSETGGAAIVLGYFFIDLVALRTRRPIVCLIGKA